MSRTWIAHLATFLIVMGLSTAAHAGRNRNGALVVHTDDSIQYSNTPDYCLPRCRAPVGN